VRSELTADGFDPSAVRYGVRSFRLVYRTVDSRGRPTTASGLMVLPAGGARRLTVVSYTHGTETYRGDAPSRQPTGFEPAPAYTFAAAGFAVADPDYLGLGTGPGLQPYLDLPSEAAAALDMLRAVRHYLTGHGETARRNVLATGFSQGGPAALALGRALQDGADPWFRIGALAPISGPTTWPGPGRPEPRASRLLLACPGVRGALRPHHRDPAGRQPHRPAADRRHARPAERPAHRARVRDAAPPPPAPSPPR
jgi:hypothetical protein